MHEVKLLDHYQARKNTEFFSPKDLLGQEHPTSRLLEDLFAHSGELSERIGLERVAYFQGFVEGHVQSCASCKVAVGNDGVMSDASNHPSPALIESAYADDNRLEEQVGPTRAAYFQGYTEGHIEGCESCHTLVDREHLKYIA